jgi:hypothetical protein
VIDHDRLSHGREQDPQLDLISIGPSPPRTRCSMCWQIDRSAAGV